MGTDGLFVHFLSCTVLGAMALAGRERAFVFYKERERGRERERERKREREK